MRLRFATFNLLHGVAVDSGVVREADLRSSARLLDADVLALQEVDRFAPRSHNADQAACVAEELGAHWWRFVDAAAPGTEEPASARPEYGIALISRLPVLQWHVRPFRAAPVRLPLHVVGRRGLVLVPDHPRVALAAVVVGPDGPFTVAATHLSFVPGWNVHQLRTITRWLRTMQAPRLVLGDLNLPGPAPRALTGWTQLARVPTYPSWRPRVQWDHVLADGMKPGAVRAVAATRLPISDHCALTVDLEW